MAGNYTKMGIYDNITQTIGRTPLVRLKRIESYFNVKNELYAKVEFFNPGGSIKDRIAKYMIEGAKKEGKIAEGAVIIEPTSGNTGVGLALVAAVEGYKTVFTMPTKMSPEKELLLKALGAFVIRTPTAVAPSDPNSYYKVAEVVRNLIWKKKKPVSRGELKEIVDYVQRLVDEGRLEELKAILEEEVEETPYAYIPNQYFNRYNPIAHYETTAKEIWEQTGGDLDYLFAGIGTGGTITGIGRYLKKKRDVKIVGVDPVGSIYHLIKKGMRLEEALKKAHPYLVEGIGEDLLPEIVDLSLIDDIVVVNDQEAFAMTRLLAKREGILAGGSSGAALYGAIKYLKENGIEGKKVVIIFPDTGRNYLTKIFNDNWLLENGFEIYDEKILEGLR
ncbi:PLP-dependent cysteine synthase family protein [Pyrococcus yayanosii]|uniref:Pyridoxal-phosphate dependent enzyme superfamily n=1 Tax=Pyrococcus yayanosii (strain CH1 / JCM 16557) TaxID=529709 RepID=F8AJA9_PYRYC|nr:cysteine synthase family protein [Pyrococcus yayanosii]AEH24554.1 Pyridoxal-phosphate dependent enzyme superfamily [Pyrococcus yayanosii CH1]